jgi:hypothetical protein
MEEGTPWISVGDLADGFEPESHAAPPSAALSGRTLALQLEDYSRRALTFVSAEEVRVQGFSPASADPVGEKYRAVELREGVFFVDFVARLERARSESLILDLGRRSCLLVTGELPDEAEARRDLFSRTREGGLELTSVTARFLNGALGQEFQPGSAHYSPTVDLVGRRVSYTYSPTERYEHIYLNENLYTWHCLMGVEKGLADTDRCHYYKLGDEFYLFVWREKLVPTLGVVVLDYQAMTSNGKIFGYAGGGFGTTANFPIGSRVAFAPTRDRD